MQTLFNIINRFVVEDRATRELNRMAASSMGLNKSLLSTGNIVGGMFALGGVYAFSKAMNFVKVGLVDYASQMEQAEVAIGAMFNASMKYKGFDGQVLSGMNKFNAALAEAQNLLQSFQVDAALSVGTTADYVMIAKHITNPLLQMGLGVDKIREFTNLTINAASVLGVDFPQAARDMMSSLTGVAGIDVKLFRLLAMKGGAKEFNQLDPQERHKRLVDAMKQYELAAQVFALTNKGLMSTITDLAMIFLGKAGRGLLETWKKNMTELLVWIKANQEAIDRFNEKFGATMSSGLQALVDGFKWIVNNRQTLMQIAAAYVGLKVFNAMSGGKGLVLGGAGILRATRNTFRGSGESIGNLLAGLSNFIPSGGQKGLANVGKTGGGAGAAWMGMFSSIGSGIAKFLSGLWRLVRYFTIAGVIITVIAGIWQAFTTNFNGCATNLFMALRRLFAPIIAVTGAKGFGGLWDILVKVATLIGSYVIEAITLFVNALAKVFEVSYRVAMAISAVWTAISNKDWAGVPDAWRRGWNVEIPLPTLPDGTPFGPKKGNPGTPETVPGNNTTINGGVHIHQEFKENHEPDRIAFATVGLLNKLARNPVQPKRALSLGGVGL